ncbi:MAG TPA: AAA family ATPase, partial [Candidatus Limnocylindrales bacterium]
MRARDDSAAPDDGGRAGPGSRHAGHSGVSFVVESKLTPPPLRPGLVVREDLLQRIFGRRHERIVAVFAPPGYGKTTLLAQWIEREPRPVAWVTVDEADSDPNRLLAYVAAAIDRAIGLDPALLELLDSTTSLIDIAVPRLTVALQDHGEPFLLVLDDVHLLGGSASVDVLSMLIDYLPARVEVGLCGRANPGLPIARHRARGAVLDVTEPDLTLDEAEALEAARAQVPEMPAADARLLHERTEGWPAAVYLATRRGWAGPSSVEVARAGRDEADLREYLEVEMLRSVSDDDRAFLVESSVVDRLTPGVCDAVVGRTDSATRLPRLSADHHLLQRLDAEGRTYRCHTLLRQHLRSLLEHEGWDARLLHRRAAAWYADEGLAEEAIEHFLAAGDRDAAARLATIVSFGLYREGRWTTVARWLDALGDETLREHPYLAAIATWAHLLEGRTTEAERMADLIESASYGPTRPAGAEPFEATRAVALAMMARDGLDVARRETATVARTEPADSPWKAAILVVHGMLLSLAGEAGPGAVVLEDAAEI